MPVGDFSAAAKIAPILLEYGNVWPMRTKEKTLVAPLTLFRCIAENQGMGTSIFESVDAAQCVNIRAWWTQDCNDSDAVKTTAFPITDCDIPSGVEDGAESQEYNPNCFIAVSKSLNDQDCQNETHAVNRSAEILANLVRSLRKGLAEQTATFVANAAMTPTFAGQGTINGNAIEFTSAEWGTTNLVHHLRLVSRKNLMGDLSENGFKIVSRR